MKRLSLVLIVIVAIVSMVYLALARPWKTSQPAAALNTDAAINQSGAVEITYIANEGVLIASGEKQVLIDGLHREYQPDYAFLPNAEREKIETAKPPFDRIDLVLVSHLHLDHFHSEAVGLYLQHNPKAQLVSSQQVVNEVEENFKRFDTIKARVVGVTPSWKEKVTMRAAGVDFEILGLRHGTGRHATIQNLGHIIKFGGKKILHIGDAETFLENFEKLNLDEEQIDIALLPYWFLVGREGQTVVREHIKPRHIIAVHISPAESDKIATQIKQAFPSAVAFTTLLEKRVY